MVKNALHFMLKALFDFEKFTFLSRLFGEVEKLLHEKARVNFKVYGVTEWRVYYYKHILSNISRSKGNQTMKFRQLIENNLRNIFLEKSNTKSGGEVGHRLFYKKIGIEHVSGSKVSNVI